jgi:hypothetical protein
MDAIAAEPLGGFAGSDHAAQCASCAAFRDEILALEQKIAAALQIPVPELDLSDLPEIGSASDNAAGVSNLPYRGRRVRSAWLALAASVLLATALGIRFLANDVEYATLGDEIIAHLDHEPRALRVSDKSVSERSLARVVRKDEVMLNRALGLITYARTCVINGREVPHLVIQGEKGPVTLLLLPEEHVDTAVQIHGEAVDGVILPVGEGSVAIVGERGENMSEIESRVVSSVEWTI